MRRLAAFALLLTAAPAGAEDLEKEPVVRALRDELSRSAKLQLPGMPAPYYVGYQVIDYRRVRVAATFGAISDRDVQDERYLRTDIRVGDMKFDSSNFFGDFGFDGPELLQLDWALLTGWTFRGWPELTMVRGTVVFEDGHVAAPPGTGRYVHDRAA